MADSHEARCYDYVNKPYAAVREAVLADPNGVFQRATTGAAKRASALAATLRIDLGPVEVGADVTIEVVGIEERHEGPHGRTPVTLVKLAWKAARAAGIFPAMEAELRIYPLSAEETQLDLHGHYRPPFGPLGDAVDAMLGHRVADASVHRFLTDVATLLKSEVPAES